MLSLLHLFEIMDYHNLIFTNNLNKFIFWMRGGENMTFDQHVIIILDELANENEGIIAECRI